MEVSNDLSAYALTRKRDALTVAYTTIYEYFISQGLYSHKLQTLQTTFYIESAYTLKELMYNVGHMTNIDDTIEIARNRFYGLDVAFSYVHRNRASFGMCMNDMWEKLRSWSCFKEVRLTVYKALIKSVPVHPIEAGCALFNWARINSSIRISPRSVIPDLVSLEDLDVLQMLKAHLPVLVSLQKRWKGSHDILWLVAQFLDQKDVYVMIVSSNNPKGKIGEPPPRKRRRHC